MKTLIVKLTHESEAKFLLALLKSISFVESVSIVNPDAEGTQVNEPEASYNWQQPHRKASDVEIDKLISEMEKDQGNFSGEEILSLVKQKLIDSKNDTPESIVDLNSEQLEMLMMG